MADPHLVIDKDEYGYPVSERYERLGANGSNEGVYVRFEPGFGLNVHIGWRTALYEGPYSATRKPTRYEDRDGLVVSGAGWEVLCLLVDEWRERKAGPVSPQTEGEQ